MSDQFEPRLIGFLCRWCSYNGADLAGTSRMKYPPNLVPIKTNCSGRVDPTHVFKACAEGADGDAVLLDELADRLVDLVEIGRQHGDALQAQELAALDARRDRGGEGNARPAGGERLADAPGPDPDRARGAGKYDRADAAARHPGHRQGQLPVGPQQRFAAVPAEFHRIQRIGSLFDELQDSRLNIKRHFPFLVTLETVLAGHITSHGWCDDHPERRRIIAAHAMLEFDRIIFVRYVRVSKLSVFKLLQQFRLGIAKQRGVARLN